MPRMLALPIALAAVLASTACASGGGPTGTAPAGSDASSTQSQAAPASEAARPSGSAGSGQGEDGEAAESGTAAPSDTAQSELVRPQIYDSTDPAMRRDPGQPGLPDASGASVDDVLRLGAVASWLRHPDWIAVSLPASSSCAPLAAEPVLESPTRIVVDFDPPSEPCGPPDAAQTYEVPVPDGVDARADVQLAVVGLEREFTLTLPAG